MKPVSASSSRALVLTSEEIAAVEHDSEIVIPARGQDPRHRSDQAWFVASHEQRPKQSNQADTRDVGQHTRRDHSR